MVDLTGVDKREKTIQEIKMLGLPVVIFGQGIYGRAVASFLRMKGVDNDIKFTVDDKYYDGSSDVVKFSEYIKQYTNDSIMIFGVQNYKFIMERKKRLKNIRYIYEIHRTWVGNELLKWDKEDVMQHLQEYDITRAMLSDERSKKVMDCYLRAAVNGEFEALYIKYYEDVAYFNDVTKGYPVDVLIDCGAFDGDSIHNFCERFASYKKIYAVEPDSLNRRKLINRLDKEKVQHVEVVPKGVYKETTVLHFSDDGTSASHIEANGVAVPVVTIDELLENEKGFFFIKMDIEGAELDALIGAENTIKKHHPILAICVYHTEDELIKIPQYIHSLVGNGVYDYHLGFYGYGLVELVFYAIPKRK